MKRYNEIKNEKILRVVTLSELQAKRHNEKSKMTGFTYIEENAKYKDDSETITKEQRDELKAKAEILGIDYPKNIKSTDLKELVEKTESEKE